MPQEELTLRELKRQLETRREQLESLKRMREELEAHEKAQFEAVMSRMLDQQVLCIIWRMMLRHNRMWFFAVHHLSGFGF